MVVPKAQRLALITVLLCFAWSSAHAQDRYAVLIGGLGGAPDQTERIGSHLRDAYHALTGPLGLDKSNVIVLAEQAMQNDTFVDGVSTADNIRAHFAALTDRLSSNDALYVMLFGHGSSDGQRAALNIPRRDLTDLDYERLADTLPVGLQVWVCTMSVSGPFVRALSAPGRIVMTATRTATQRNRTIFPTYFVESLTVEDADLDQDGSLSVIETFRYAAEKTAFHYSSRGQLATEHSLLDDTGDGEGVRFEDLPAAADGHLARITYLRQADISRLMASDDPMSVARQDLERQIASLQAQKSAMDVDAYYKELEDLFVRLARLNDRIEATAQ